LSALAGMLAWVVFFSSEIGPSGFESGHREHELMYISTGTNIKNKMNILFFSSCLGKGEVIKGWDLGVATMKRGERAIFFIRQPRDIVLID
jgi:FKBP-type peptidyl-prolyl cis-trans isomerase